MKFLVLILVVAPIYATGDVFGDLLGQEYVTLDHVREKRQAQNYRPLNQGPPHLQQILQAQASRPPLIPIPAHAPPKLGPAQPIQPQKLSQNQVSPYQPQVSFGGGAQQANYKNIPVNSAQYKKPIIPQQPQYRPIPANNYPQQAAQPNYNAPQQQYSSKLPPHIQQLLQYQNNLSNGFPQKRL